VTLAKPPGVRAAFPVLTVANDCYPIHALHAHVKPADLLTVAVRAGATVLQGVKPYELHVERKRERGHPPPAPIAWAEVEAALAGLPLAQVRPDVAEFDVHASPDHAVTFRLRDGRISFPGNPAYFAPGSPVWQSALTLKQRLGARVYDDIGGYLFETVESLNTLEPE
jgi:hypothetical protein